MNVKIFIPKAIRLKMKLLCRSFKDTRSKEVFSRLRGQEGGFCYIIEEVQAIRRSSFFENKVENIRLGASFIEDIIINSNEILSFWTLIGNPGRKRGFKEGRNLISGKLCSDYGGGLCQLSGILYLTAIRGGLEIKERHNHTVDIYKEEERFAPLGSDATIVYGYKDLRIKNPYDFPLKFRFEVSNDTLTCQLLSVEKIVARNLEFIRLSDTGKNTFVETQADSVVIAHSKYTVV